MKSFPSFSSSRFVSPWLILFGLTTLSAHAQKLHCSPCWHGFGKVQIGSSESFNIRLRNSGSSSLTITADSVQGGEFSVGTFPLPETLNPGASVELPVIFTPTASGHSVGSVTLADTGEDPQLTVKLAGTGVGQTSHSVALSWQPGDDNYVGFNIYRSTADGGPYTKINSTLDSSPSYTDSSVQDGMTYYYAATEVNAEGQESAYSNIAEAQIPDS